MSANRPVLENAHGGGDDDDDHETLFQVGITIHTNVETPINTSYRTMISTLCAHTSNLSSCNTREFFSVLSASISVCFWMRFSVNALTRFPNSSSLVEVSALVASCGG